MKAVLIYKDGRRVDSEWVGAARILVPHSHEDGRYTETTFHAARYDKAADTVFYDEGETVDRTREMRLAAEENERRVWETFRLGLEARAKRPRRWWQR